MAFNVLDITRPRTTKRVQSLSISFAGVIGSLDIQTTYIWITLQHFVAQACICRTCVNVLNFFRCIIPRIWNMRHTCRLIHTMHRCSFSSLLMSSELQACPKLKKSPKGFQKFTTCQKKIQNSPSGSVVSTSPTTWAKIL